MCSPFSSVNKCHVIVRSPPPNGMMQGCLLHHLAYLNRQLYMLKMCFAQCCNQEEYQRCQYRQSTHLLYRQFCRTKSLVRPSCLSAYEREGLGLLMMQYMKLRRDREHQGRNLFLVQRQHCMTSGSIAGRVLVQSAVDDVQTV